MFTRSVTNIRDTFTRASIRPGRHVVTHYGRAAGVVALTAALATPIAVSSAAVAGQSPAAAVPAPVAPPLLPTYPTSPPVTEPASPPPPTAAAPIPAAPAPAPPAEPFGGQTRYDQVAPHGEQGEQTHMQLNGQQKQYAETIVQVASDRGMDAYAATIAVATALQESGLKNYTNAVDHDSLGLFQQRPSTGWGSPDEITDPAYAANAFLSALDQNGYEGKSLTEAAQDTQGSAYPDAYAKWHDQAADIVSEISNGQF